MTVTKIDISAFSPHLFWDVDITGIKLQEHVRFVIKKVLIYGFYNDWHIIFQLYGKKTVCEYAKTIRELDPKTAHFIACISDTPITDFKCYTTTPSIPQHWNF